MEWHWQHFTAVNQDDGTGTWIFFLDGKLFARNVDDEQDDCDSSMRGDVDTPHLEVRADLEHWSEWYVHLTGALCFPFDAVRHIDVEFVHHWRHAVTART